MKLLDPGNGIKTIDSFPGGEQKPGQGQGIQGLPGLGAPAGDTSGDLTRRSVLDSVIHTLFGKPSGEKTDQENAKDAGKRGEAGKLAAGAATNPGESFMGIPSGGSGEFGGGIMKVFQTILGGLTGGGA